MFTSRQDLIFWPSNFGDTIVGTLEDKPPGRDSTPIPFRANILKKVVPKETKYTETMKDDSRRVEERGVSIKLIKRVILRSGGKMP